MKNDELGELQRKKFTAKFGSTKPKVNLMNLVNFLKKEPATVDDFYEIFGGEKDKSK